MTEIPINTEKYLEEAVAVRAIAHGEARDDRDARQDRTTAALIDMLRDLQRESVATMKSGGAAVQDLKDSLLRVETKVEKFMSAFPNGDADGHRRAHEDQIKVGDKNEIFWGKIKFTLVALLLSGAVVWISIVLWKAFLMGPK
jgi:hypothetical protein